MRKRILRTFAALLFTIASTAAPLSVAAQQGGTTRYVYDDNGRLHAVIAPTGEAAVYEYDAAGNFTAIRRLAADTLTLFDFSPKRGTAGDLVTFIGVGFSQGVSLVSFNGVTARVVEFTGSTIVAEVPDATTGPVSITTSRGTVTTPQPFTIVPRIRIKPASLSPLPGDVSQLTAVVTSLSGDNTVIWSVDGVQGGNSSAGTISTSGLYTAPASYSSIDIVVRATSVAVPSLFAEATVSLHNPNSAESLFAPAVSVRRGSGLGPEMPSAIASVTTGPYISAVTPNSVSSGSVASITITGANLDGATGLTFIRVGSSSASVDLNVTASNLSVNTDGKSLTATVTVNNDATALGRHVVVVSTPRGDSLTIDLGSNVIVVPQ